MLALHLARAGRLAREDAAVRADAISHARAGGLVLLRYALADPSVADRVALARTVAVLEASR